MELLKTFINKDGTVTHTVIEMNSLTYYIDSYNADNASVRQSYDTDGIVYLIHELRLIPYGMNFDDIGRISENVHRTKIKFSQVYNS